MVKFSHPMKCSNIHRLLGHHVSTYGIEDELSITDIFSMTPMSFPFKTMSSLVCFVIKGNLELNLDMQSISLHARSLLMIREGQVIMFNACSDDNKCVFIELSKLFLSSLNLPNRSSIILSVYGNPVFRLSSKDFASMKLFTYVLRNIISNERALNRLEIIRHISLAFFYSIQHIHAIENNKTNTRSEVIFNNFIRLVGQNFKTERNVKFYADKLCISSKYLGVIVKSVSGKSALSWIDNHVILEAKALLKSTDYTVLQISDKLNFPTQSCFGKFFKRHTGMSPVEYR